LHTWKKDQGYKKPEGKSTLAQFSQSEVFAITQIAASNISVECGSTI